METTMTTPIVWTRPHAITAPPLATPPSTPVTALRVSSTRQGELSGERFGARPLWEPASGRFDPGRLRAAIVARGWTVPEFTVASTVSRSCLYKALRGYAVGDRTVVRILGALDSRAPTGLLDD